jgi:hypothetical protein
LELAFDPHDIGGGEVTFVDGDHELYAGGFGQLFRSNGSTWTTEPLVGSNIYGWGQYAERDKKQLQPEEVMSALRDAGFQGGTIVGADLHLTGNLRAAFPKARVLDASVAPDSYPARQGNGACLVVWRDTRFNDTLNVALMPEQLSTYLEQELDVRLRDKGARGAVRRPLRMSEDMAATLYFQLNRASGQCG